ncbi:sodium-dependent multivitamin transporter-like [Argonauta hians]
MAESSSIFSSSTTSSTSSSSSQGSQNKELSNVDLVLLFIVVFLPVVCNLIYTIYRHVTKKDIGRRVAVNTIPVALSLTASYLSANTIMGVPAIMINQGLSYWFLILTFPLSTAIVAHLVLPVTYSAKLPDIYKYLELRYAGWFRWIGAAVFCLLQMVYLSIVLHGPAILFELILKKDPQISIVAIGLICSLYTALGGLKANTYIEAFQLITMFVGLLAIVISIFSTTSISQVFHNATINDTAASMFKEGQYYSVTSTVIGGTILYASIYAVNQSQVQRYFSCATLKHAKCSLWLNSPGLIIIVSLCCMFGAFLRAVVPKTDDPIDKIVGRFLVEDVETGVAGLFIAGVFNATMSSISCGLSATNSVLFRNLLPKRITENQNSELISSILSFLIGIFCIILAILIQNEQGILKASFSFYGIFCCPMFGVFLLGIFFPFVHKWGALVGLSMTIPFLLFLHIGNSMMHHHTMAVSLQKLFQINFFWFGPIGVSMVIVIGIISSKLIGGFQDASSVPQGLLSPITLKIMDKYIKYDIVKSEEKYRLEEMNTTEKEHLNDSEV